MKLDNIVQLEFPFTKKGASQHYAIHQDKVLNKVYRLVAGRHFALTKQDFYGTPKYIECCKSFRAKYHDKYFSNVLYEPPKKEVLGRLE